MVFSKSKDEILESYAIVKGGTDLLDENTRKQFIGLRETKVGFEGLTDNLNNIKSTFGNKVLIEKASLEDIMVYSVRGGKSMLGIIRRDLMLVWHNKRERFFYNILYTIFIIDIGIL